MLDVGLSIAAGKQRFFGYTIVKQGAVLYIAAEGAGVFQYRVRAWCSEHEVDPLMIPFWVIPMPVNLRDPSCQQELLAIIAETHPILIVVDTVARCTPGAEENSARDMGEVIAFCSTLQQPSNATFAFVHHPPKGDPTGGGRGSGALFGAVDTEIRVATDGKAENAQGARAVEVTCAKQKDDLRPPPLKLVGRVVPVRDLQGQAMAHQSERPITSIVLGVASQAIAGEKAKKAAEVDRATDLKVLRTMHDDSAATSQLKLRASVGLNFGVVVESVSRIVSAGWATTGSRGQPYTLTDLGKKQFEPPL